MSNSFKNSLLPVKVTGCDIGNEGTKTSRGVFFPSKVYKGDAPLDFSTLAIKVRWNDQIYIVGDFSEGVTFENIDKIDKEEYQVAFLASIAMSYLNDLTINTIVGIGLPYDYYDDIKVREEYRTKTLELGVQHLDIIIDENTVLSKCINIVDVDVYAQGAIVKSIPSDCFPALVCDFGGKTFDITKWTKTTATKLTQDLNNSNNNVVEIQGKGKSNKDFGFNKVLDDIIKQLDTKGITIKSRQELLARLKESELKRLGRNPVDFDRLKDRTIGIYASRVLSYLENEDLFSFNYLYFIGGCAELVKEYMVKNSVLRDEDIRVLDNPRFFNAMEYARRSKENLDKTRFILEDSVTGQNN